MPELPPILHSQRFRSLFLSLTLLAFAGYTLTSVEQAADASFPSTYPSSSAGQGAYRDGAEADAQSSASQSKWRPSAWNVPSWAGSAFGGGKSVVQSNAQALGWVGEHPESLEGWEEGSLKHWKASEAIELQPYEAATAFDPPTGTYSAGVVWLTRGRNMQTVFASLESLARYMPMEQAYSFILMHQGDLSAVSVQESIRQRWADRAEQVAEGGEVALADKMREMAKGIEFLEINMDAPTSVAKKGIDGWEDVVFKNVWPGYHSMCRFFAVNIFWNPRIRELDYYMRMDSDSYLLSPMYQDPFRRIQASGKSYAYRQGGGDPEFVVHGMADYIESWVASNGAALDAAGELDPQLGGAAGVQARINESRLVESSRTSRNGGMGAYYNNWELVHVPSFRKPGVKDWLEGLANHDEGFYRYRWGDAPLRYVTVQMFFKPEQYEHYCDFTYYHQFMMKEGEMISSDPPQWKC